MFSIVIELEDNFDVVTILLSADLQQFVVRRHGSEATNYWSKEAFLDFLRRADLLPRAGEHDYMPGALEQHKVAGVDYVCGKCRKPKSAHEPVEATADATPLQSTAGGPEVPPRASTEPPESF